MLCGQIVVANDVGATRCRGSLGTLDRIDPKELQISRKLFAPDVTFGFRGLLATTGFWWHLETRKSTETALNPPWRSHVGCPNRTTAWAWRAFQIHKHSNPSKRLPPKSGGSVRRQTGFARTADTSKTASDIGCWEHEQTSNGSESMVRGYVRKGPSWEPR